MTPSRWEPLDEAIADRTKRPLEVLQEVAKYQRYLAAIERRTVQAARSEGRTWDEIGAASGVTRQASWKRWGRTLTTQFRSRDPEASFQTALTSPARAVTARRWVVSVSQFADVEQVGPPYRTGEDVEIVIAADDADLRRRVVDFLSGLAFGSGGRLDALDRQRLHLVSLANIPGPEVD